VRLVGADVVDHVVAGTGFDAVEMVRELEDQWKVWPPSITIDCPVTKSEPGPLR
jgi:hypothetical protein